MFRVGFSQCTMVNKWRQTMLEGMRRELSFHPEIEFFFKNADGNTQTQVSQIQELIDQDIDLLIVSPNVAEPITPIVEKAYAKGIKVIIVDRRTTSRDYTAYVGASNIEVGMNAASVANSLLKGKGNVLEVSDIPGSSADIDRHNGFTETLAKYPGLHYLGKVYEKGDEHPSGEALTGFLKTNADVQFIFTQNDRLALSASDVCREMGLNRRVQIVGVDGLPGENGGIDLVEKGVIKATVFYPTGGEEAIIAAVNILKSKPFRKEIPLTTTIIDSTNVRIMKLQNEKLLAQQKDIDRRQQKIEEQEVIARNKTNIIYIISISLALALILGSILFFYLKENRKINARLALQNDQLIELGNKAKEATDAKIKFFTNVSHEFRTPLTLILGPLEELMNNSKLQFATKQYLALIQKNTIRLLKLVNELIDFRKIEVDKMYLRATENDLVAFVNEITGTFTALAKKRNIDLRVIGKERYLPVWFDTSMMDKVIFNLLSNAFKFTNDNGFIQVTVEKNNIAEVAVIKVEDNGIGMSPDVVAHAFELFYQAIITSQQSSGLGLSLSKELMKLHHGDIKVSSKQWKGTCFEIQLPLGNAHLEPKEMLNEHAPAEAMYYDDRIYTTELDVFSTQVHEGDGVENRQDRSVLIIEDNEDLLNFLVDRLSTNYQVLVADNGITALQQAFDNVPDLIISDLILPGKDGIEVTNTLKTDFRTSHIPIILLTARSEVQEQIEGMRNMADAYIVKPFNLQFLEETIKSVMKNREILREHYTSELNLEVRLQGPQKLDRKFINEFNAIVETNIGNEHFTIEELCVGLGISRVQLYRKVKALLGYNVNDYILQARLQKARHYLGKNELSISEIAYKVGFSSASYFSTVFKSKFGKTPKEFREK